MQTKTSSNFKFFMCLLHLNNGNYLQQPIGILFKFSKLAILKLTMNVVNLSQNVKLHK